MNQCVVDFDRVCIGECATRSIVLKNIGALGTGFQIAKVCALFLSTHKLKCVYLRTYVHGYVLVDTVEACDLRTYVHAQYMLFMYVHVWPGGLNVKGVK